MNTQKTSVLSQFCYCCHKELSGTSYKMRHTEIKFCEECFLDFKNTWMSFINDPITDKPIIKAIVKLSPQPSTPITINIIK